jgi:hypothetical protein
MLDEEHGVTASDAASQGKGRQRVARMPEGARPPVDLYAPALGKDGAIVVVEVRADGWVLADVDDMPIHLDGIQYKID